MTQIILMILKGPKVSMRFLVALLLLSSTAPLWARPIITEHPATLTKFMFEAGFDLSKRFDEFGSTNNSIDTVVFPVHFNLGLTDKTEFGFTIQHSAQNLETDGEDFSGSSVGQFAMELKRALNDRLSLQAIWELQSPAEEDEELPILRGNNVELNALLTLPVEWPTHINVGYSRQGRYDSDLGVKGGQVFQVEPGNIFQAKGSVEAPLRYHISLLTELAYYKVEDRAIGGVEVPGSAGDALDLLSGLVWNYAGWNIAGGVSFGMLDESHTSFDIQRGSGDYKVHFSLSYRLKPKKPE